MSRAGQRGQFVRCPSLGGMTLNEQVAWADLVASVVAGAVLLALWLFVLYLVVKLAVRHGINSSRLIEELRDIREVLLISDDD